MGRNPSKLLSMETWQTVILAVIEGLTEFLPISSTGHMVIASTLMGIEDNPFVKNFEIMVQFAAILAVLILYWRRFVSGRAIYQNLAMAFLPTAVIGFLLKKHVDVWLGHVEIVATTTFLGGFILLWVERKFPNHEAGSELTSLTGRQAFFIGLCQCLALAPGVSRSGATMVAALFFGLKRRAAAEFSFLLAVPTLGAATLYKSVKVLPLLDRSQAGSLLLGSLIALVVAVFAIRTFIAFLNRRGFAIFGWYRIALGLLILTLLLTGFQFAQV